MLDTRLLYRMLEDVELSFYPSCLNSIRWSEDGEVALAAGENVQLLIPRYFLQSTYENQWDLVRFKVNSFTAAEFHRPRSAKSHTATIGESQSPSHVVSLAWSPPGLAKHRRCALSVLTSNHVLALWDSESDPRYGRSWRRYMVVNNELSRSTSAIEKHQEDDFGEAETSKRKQSRIIAFGWSQVCDIGADDRYGVTLLAVSRDSDEIVIARIPSPHDVLPTARIHQALEILGKVNVDDSTNGNSASTPSLLTPQSRVLYVPTSASQLAWSPWVVVANGGSYSFLAYFAHGRVHVAIVYMFCDGQDSEQVPKVAVEVEPKTLPVSVPLRSSVLELKWHDKVQYIPFFQHIDVVIEYTVDCFKVHKESIVLAIATPEIITIVYFFQTTRTTNPEGRVSIASSFKRDALDFGTQRIEMESWNPISGEFCAPRESQLVSDCGLVCCSTPFLSR